MKPIPSLSPSASTRGGRSLRTQRGTISLQTSNRLSLDDLSFVNPSPSIFHRHTADLPFMDYLSPGAMVVIPGIISNKCWMIKEIYLFGETDQFIRNYKHCSAASYCCCRSFWSLPYTSSYSQVHTCSLWNTSCTSCTSNTLLRRYGSLGDSNLRTPC